MEEYLAKFNTISEKTINVVLIVGCITLICVASYILLYTNIESKEILSGVSFVIGTSIFLYIGFSFLFTNKSKIGFGEDDDPISFD